MKIVPTVLSGGSGTRLWPMSRSFDPKQLQPIVGDTSLIAQTVERLSSHPQCVAPVVICNGAYADQVVEDLRSAGTPPSAVLEEPCGRDTAAAAALAALWARKTYGDDSVVLLLPSDHFISKIDALHQTVVFAAEAASNDFITTIGLKPTRPETGYGYIRRKADRFEGSQAFPIDEFAEKPDLETAVKYVDSGEFTWNSGMFIYTPGTFLEEMNTYCSDILAATEKAFDAAKVEMDQGVTARVEIPMDLFKEIPKNSIDFAVMEHTKKGAVVEADLGWSDIGSWKSVHETLSPDGEGNVHDGKVLLDCVKNSLVLSRSDRHIALAGVDDLVVVDTPDALLICSSDASQAVKAIHKQLDQSGADCARLHGPETKAYEGFMRRWTRDWLFDNVLPLWAEKGIDPDLGGAVEALDLNGEPMRDLPRRLRVQTRQTYTFAFAYSMGWEPGLEAMRKPLEYMLKHYRHENGGWIAKVAPNGDPIDESVESYEMAFVILSLGWAAKVTGDQELFKLGEEAVDFLLTRMRHPAGGFVENLTGQPYRRANPHMHLLEAAIHWAELFQHERMFDVTREIYGLYKSHFCVNGLLREYFDEELNLPTVPVSPEHMFVEPGHLMEWAYLLRRYGRLHGIEEETVATLSGFAERYGVCNTTGLLVDHCTTMGDIPDSVGSRLWPQTEAVRFWLDRNGEGDRPRALELLSRMKDHYMTFNGETPGYWRDIIQQDGTAVGDKAPSSSLYHLMGAAEAVLR